MIQDILSGEPYYGAGVTLEVTIGQISESSVTHTFTLASPEHCRELYELIDRECEEVVQHREIMLRQEYAEMVEYFQSATTGTKEVGA